MRSGAQIRLADGTHAFLAYDDNERSPPAVRDKYVREAAILRAIEGTGIRAPTLLASDPDVRAHLFEFVEGEDRFSKLTDAEDARAVAHDFLNDLAILHRLDAASLTLEGFAPCRPVAEMVRETITDLEYRHAAGGEEDPFIVFGLDWLNRHVPDYQGPPVVVHGDAGPGNLLFSGHRVTAVLDWEQAHFGDPMEDFAWMSIRAIIQTWVPFAPLLRTYERLADIPVSPERIRFYRIYTLLGMMVDSHRRYFQQPQTLADQARLGTGLMFAMVHRRACVQGLADAMALALPEYEPPVRETPFADSPMIESVLRQLKEVIVPRSQDQVGRETAKDMARVLKYIDARARREAVLTADELTDLAGVLGDDHDSLGSARAHLLQRIRAGSMSDEVMLGILWRRVCRETAVARGLMGALSERRLPSLGMF